MTKRNRKKDNKSIIIITAFVAVLLVLLVFMLKLVANNVLPEQQMGVIISGVIIFISTFVVLLNEFSDVFERFGIKLPIAVGTTISMIFSILWLIWILSVN